MTAPPTTGQRVAAARQTRGWRQQDLAAALGVVPSHVSYVEHGHVLLTFDELFLWARALDVMPVDLMADDPLPRHERRGRDGAGPLDRRASMELANSVSTAEPDRLITLGLSLRTLARARAGRMPLRVGEAKRLLDAGLATWPSGLR